MVIAFVVGDVRLIVAQCGLARVGQDLYNSTGQASSIRIYHSQTRLRQRVDRPQCVVADANFTANRVGLLDDPHLLDCIEKLQ